MSRLLICAMLVTVLSGGSVPAPHQAPAPLAALPMLPMLPVLPVLPVLPTPAAALTPADSTVPAGPDDPGDQPAMPARMFGWPLPGHPAVVRAFQAPAQPFGPGHRGVDLAAAPGTPVLAAGAGTVVFAGTVAGHGVVSVDHPGGLRTTYEPVSPTVTAGDLVAKGEQIGTVALGHPGCAAPACLHWGVRRGPAHNRDYLDPLRLLATPRVRLLPLDTPAGVSVPHAPRVRP